ncbi:hypothetical protein [Cronobacter sakazakii]|uniref:hypothetical protein n=1 Tax=Cronobacter sakazakii TaxID=28141 RepID=UPI000CFCDF29|nr:hypothetical protein [Cronobacter sakazakii]MCI0222296.1 hypothetical protein [Cronobacter sakazakii]
MSEIDYERVQFLHDVATECARDGTEIALDADEVILYLTEPLLALRERAEPVAWISESNLKALARGHRSVYVKNEPILTRPVALYTAPPAPVVPDDVLAALRNVAKIRLDFNDFDGDRRGMADCLGEAEEALIEVVNRRAAMLAAPDKEG